MSLHRRYFLPAVTLATVAATPAFGQVTPTVGAANSGKQGAASIPDFSGVWTHSIPGFEPLASGPTALVNRSRRQNGTGDNLQLVGDYTNPILKPQAAEVVPARRLPSRMGSVETFRLRVKLFNLQGRISEKYM